MRRAALLGWLIMMCADFAQSQTTVPLARRPISDSIARDFARFDATEPAPDATAVRMDDQQLSSSDWSRVTGLRPGTAIDVTTVSMPAVERYFVRADAAELTVLNIWQPSLPKALRNRLRDLATVNPMVLLRARHNAILEDGPLRIGPLGVFYEGQKVAELDDVVITYARPDVRQISRFVKRGSVLGAVAGGAAGFVVGYQLAVGLVYRESSFPMMLSIIGLPIGTALLGYHAASHVVDTVGYRASRVQH